MVGRICIMSLGLKGINPSHPNLFLSPSPHPPGNFETQNVLNWIESADNNVIVEQTKLLSGGGGGDGIYKGGNIHRSIHGSLPYFLGLSWVQVILSPEPLILPQLELELKNISPHIFLLMKCRALHRATMSNNGIVIACNTSTCWCLTYSGYQRFFATELQLAAILQT